MYTYSVIPFRYQSPISDHIQGLKYSAQLHYAASLTKMLLWWVMKNTPELPETIIPMPLHWQRIRQRGFNQASEISRILSRSLDIPIENSLIRRVKNTVTQTGLSEKMRAMNLKNAFEVQGSHSYAHVALVDDVVTSGSTVNAAASCLIASGVKNVSVWAIAKT